MDILVDFFVELFSGPTLPQILEKTKVAGAISAKTGFRSAAVPAWATPIGRITAAAVPKNARRSNFDDTSSGITGAFQRNFFVAPCRYSSLVLLYG